MGKWSDHGGSYYNCNKYVENDVRVKDGKKLTKEETARVAKKELDRYLHYYERFQNHEAGIKFAATNQRAVIEKKMNELQVMYE